MAILEDKIKFLKTTVIPFLKSLDPNAKGLWGVMTPQQMVEHLVLSVKVSNGKINGKLYTSPDNLPKYQEFIKSEKEFRPNTKNPLLKDTPPPHHYPSYEAAVQKLETELNDFFAYFEKNPNATLIQPIFGELNYEGWIQMHYKHLMSHLKQFGLTLK